MYISKKSPGLIYNETVFSWRPFIFRMRIEAKLIRIGMKNAPIKAKMGGCSLSGSDLAEANPYVMQVTPANVTNISTISDHFNLSPVAK